MKSAKSTTLKVLIQLGFRVLRIQLQRVDEELAAAAERGRQGIVGVEPASDEAEARVEPDHGQRLGHLPIWSRQHNLRAQLGMHRGQRCPLR